MPTISPKVTPYYGGGQVVNPADTFQTTGIPSTANINHNLGTIAIDNAAKQAWMLVSKTGNSATWSPTAGISSFSISPYIVGPAGKAGYQTIQSALDAANAAGGNATVYVQPGTYTENLTLYTTVDIAGSIYDGAIIVGVHTPPAAGRVMFQNLSLNSATHIFSSSAAGTTSIIVDTCLITVTNGYTFNLLNWTGYLELNDIGDNSTNNGVINNTGGATVELSIGAMGAGTGNTLTYAGGSINFDAVDVGCPISVGTGATLTAHLGTTFERTLTTANNSIVNITGAYFGTGATAAISHGSSGTFLLANSVINSSNSPSIAGSGAGVMSLGDITFVSNSAIAGTLTTTWLTTRTAAAATATGAAASPVVVNGRSGAAIFSSVSIAAAADLTLTITNSSITDSATQVIYSLAGATTGSALQIKSVTNSAGSSAVVVTNGTGATTSTANITLTFLVLN